MNIETVTFEDQQGMLSMKGTSIMRDTGVNLLALSQLQIDNNKNYEDYGSSYPCLEDTSFSEDDETCSISISSMDHDSNNNKSALMKMFRMKCTSGDSSLEDTRNRENEKSDNRISFTAASEKWDHGFHGSQDALRDTGVNLLDLSQLQIDHDKNHEDHGSSYPCLEDATFSEDDETCSISSSMGHDSNNNESALMKMFRMNCKGGDSSLDETRNQENEKSDNRMSFQTPQRSGTMDSMEARMLADAVDRRKNIMSFKAPQRSGTMDSMEARMLADAVDRRKNIPKKISGSRRGGKRGGTEEQQETTNQENENSKDKRMSFNTPQRSGTMDSMEAMMLAGAVAKTSRQTKDHDRQQNIPKRLGGSRHGGKR
eukprot:CAMPEP_0198154588 /NCGR_PEP_ID=MMETSP1443-20131203/68677_1 /TAXON_ID=186043 /ORGANISM="Entomoneis sp., Strain CCMP2396" /LENGTH=370 /DNA_ID=CAMNT_0043821269 /DNA_START=82 /DNA_END=1193 /DNA_ORIENTATION=-